MKYVIVVQFGENFFMEHRAPQIPDAVMPRLYKTEAEVIARLEQLQTFEGWPDGTRWSVWQLGQNDDATMKA